MKSFLNDSHFLLTLLKLSLWSSLFFCQPPLCHAFVKCITKEGTLIHYDSPFKLNLLANLNRESPLSDQDFFQATTRSLQRWEEASQNQFHFDYWQGQDRKIFPTTGERDGKSTLFFISGSKSSSGTPTILSKNTLGITELWYDTHSGKISEFDILLNDLDFQFTNHPDDSSGFGNSRRTITSSKTPVFIENVITHELGHALGLSHSAALQSTMLFTESPEQAHLGCDDQIGIQTLYAEPGLKDHRGIIQGRILTPSGAPLLGAHVVALSIDRGTLLATTLTNAGGIYQLENLEPGLYHLLVEPYFAGTSVLPEYYDESPSHFCKSHSQEPQSFVRTLLFQKSPFQLKSIEVKPNSLSSVEDFQVECQSTIQKIEKSPHEILQVEWQDHETEKHFGITYQGQINTSHLIDLGEISGDLKIHGLSYSLYSPLHIHAVILDQFKNRYPAEIKNPIQTSDSGFTNFDMEITARELPKGQYFLELTYSKLSTQDYPAGPVSLDSIPYVVLIGTLNQKSREFEHSLPDHPRCKSPETYPFYQSPPLPHIFSNPVEHLTPATPGASPGCIRGFLAPSEGPLQGVHSLLSWIFCFLSSHFILQLFKYLLTQRPADKLKL